MHFRDVRGKVSVVVRRSIDDKNEGSPQFVTMFGVVADHWHHPRRLMVFPRSVHHVIHRRNPSSRGVCVKVPLQIGGQLLIQSQVANALQ